ncbi:hypothetical protein NDU88_002843 [Pleurodeles waltl]|uniref:Uncharacterized protein n=1 Tax=Pleurodeles waltl TaxID=8319 RepID=A0AAV7WPS2_PLEWA|nr:hypothetical protein NDU88_002843 [Pleurodeles waltl]
MGICSQLIVAVEVEQCSKHHHYHQDKNICLQLSPRLVTMVTGGAHHELQQKADEPEQAVDVGWQANAQQHRHRIGDSHCKAELLAIHDHAAHHQLAHELAV